MMTKSGVFFTGVLGGCLGALLMQARPVSGVEKNIWATLTGSRVTVMGDAGRKIDILPLSAQGSAVFFHDAKDRARMELGLYEDGIPFIALEGETHLARSIYRLAGSNQAPVLVFKDKGGHDRMILGLDMNGSDEEPFLVTFDKSGRKKVHFGTY